MGKTYRYNADEEDYNSRKRDYRNEEEDTLEEIEAIKEWQERED